MRRLQIAFALLPTMFAMPAATGDDAQPDDAQPDAAAVAFFESKVRPVLVRHCNECHSAESGTAEAGLRVDSRDALAKGGDRGRAIVPGKPDASLLLTAVTHADPDLMMPPDKPRLSQSVLADLRKWIRMGAPDPRVRPAEETRDSETARHHWAYQRPVRSTVPQVDDPAWSRDAIDAFVFAKRASAGLGPSKAAAPGVLLRRVHFDLIGLPPSPKTLRQFLSAVDDNGLDIALQEQVDRLLESPRFGERWGRHWLDVARFGESSGGESNISFPHAWRYRDYVIDAVNADVPYDRFLTEQIAGDLLPHENDSERARLLIATGFLAVGTKNLGEADEKQFQADIVDEQIDSLTRAVMASSVACARCHHHKFDPFTMDDYYALAGIFHSTKTFFGTHTSPANRRSGDPLPLPEVSGQVVLHRSLSKKRFQQLKEQMAELESEWSDMEAAKYALFAGKKPAKTYTLRDVLRNIWRRGPIEGTLESVDDQGRAIPIAMGVLDRTNVADAPLLARGEIARPGDTVARGFPEALKTDSTPSIVPETSGRLAMARWLTDPTHPLTTRVFVNRVWHHLFGTGLVATVDNFGTTGETPSHPELLDQLALDFVQQGWSLKRLLRRLVLSQTYRQSSEFSQDAFKNDPENRLLWRMSKRRLQAEAIRDAMLVASGELDTQRPVGSLVARDIGDKPISLIGLNRKLPADLDGMLHRSVYLPVIRDRLPDVLEMFDFAEPSLVTGDRDQTNVPLQALYLMNSDFVHERAVALSARLAKVSDGPREQIHRAFRICFGRAPDAGEQERSAQFVSQAGDGGLTTFCQALLSTAEFRNLD